MVGVTDLSARYGTKRRPRWFWPAITAVGVLIGVGFAAWVGFQDKPVSAKVWGYDVLDDHQVAVKLDVSRAKAITVECTVYAQASDHSVVGEKTVTVPPSANRTTRIQITIETERKAVNGVLRSCLPRK